MKPLCIYIASRLSTHPEHNAELSNADIILAYIYNVKESLKASAEIWKKGHYPFVPALDFLLYLEVGELHPALPYEAGLEWVRRCDAILIVNGLENSKGVQKEYEVAKKHGKKIFYAIEEVPTVE